MALVNFKRGTKPSDVSSLDANTIYFFSDSQEIYLGSTPYSGNLEDLKEELQGLIDAKANASDLEALEETVEGLETDLATKADASDLDKYLTKEKAAEDYLTKTDAEGTYAKKSDLDDYLTTEVAGNTYATKTEVSAVETTANNAKTAAENAQKAADAAQGDATKALADAKAAQDDVDALEGTVDGHTTQLAGIATEQTTQNGRLTDIETWLGELFDGDDEEENLKAAIESLIGDVTAGGLIKEIHSGNGIQVTGGAGTDPYIAVKIADNSKTVLSATADGLGITLPEQTDYTVSVSTATTATQGYAKTYEIKQGAEGEETVVGKIDIPKDLVVSSGSVVVDADDSHEGTWIKLVLNNDDVIWIAASDLVDTVTANNGDAPVVSITVTDGTKIGATLNNGTVTKAHLVTAVQTTLDHADETYAALTWGTV